VDKPLPDIRLLDEGQLSRLVQDAGQPAFRTGQLISWQRDKRALSFDEMTNLPLAFREWLSARYGFYPLAFDMEQQSADGTLKMRFRLHDGLKVEGVLIPAGERVTACISSQAGCSLDCLFCATGRMGLLRHLETAEIFDQVWLLREHSLRYFGRPLSNIVFMGMGEPLLNYQRVRDAIEWIHRPEGLNVSYRRITVSTSGIVKAIRRLAEDRVKFHLALSLHATTDAVRDRMMSINRTNPIGEVMEALRAFYLATRSRVTFEYLLFEGINDTEDDAERLASLARSVPARVNLIEYNPVEGVPYAKPAPERMEWFARQLETSGVTVTLRHSRGKDIDAACGQLANKD